MPGINSSNPCSFVSLNDKLYFFDDDDIHGRELWKSDGTVAGTTLVRDIWPGATGSDPAKLKKLGNAIWFTANNGGNGYEVWRSTGDSAGTVMVQDINPVSGSSNPSMYTQVDDKMFFTASAGSYGFLSKIWVGTIGSSAPLPVLLQNFKGIILPECIKLSWQSLNNQHILGFVVQRSYDGFNFEDISYIGSSGFNEVNTYSFSDYEIIETGMSVVYYRLHIKANDGSSSFSKVLILKIQKKSFSIVAWPNPVENDWHLLIQLQSKDNISLHLYDLQGHLLQKYQFILDKGTHSKTLHFKPLSNGVYVVSISGRYLKWKFKLIKQ
jgi:ELWxxDGT repeat protein